MFSTLNDNILLSFTYLGLPHGTSSKESVCQCRRHKRNGFNPWIGKIPCRSKWQSTSVLLPGKSHGQRSLSMGPWRYLEYIYFLLFLPFLICFLNREKRKHWNIRKMNTLIRNKNNSRSY